MAAKATVAAGTARTAGCGKRRWPWSLSRDRGNRPGPPTVIDRPARACQHFGGSSTWEVTGLYWPPATYRGMGDTTCR